MRLHVANQPQKSLGSDAISASRPGTSNPSGVRRRRSYRAIDTGQRHVVDGGDEPTSRQALVAPHPPAGSVTVAPPCSYDAGCQALPRVGTVR